MGTLTENVTVQTPAKAGLEIHHRRGRTPAARGARRALAGRAAQGDASDRLALPLQRPLASPGAARPRVTQAVSEAAAQGDRSENAEYIYGKRRLREIDSRVRFLRKRLDGMVIVDQAPADLRRVFFGAWVSLESEDGMESRYRIVGPDEFDMAPH